jgi:hypothetical protein
MQPNAFKYYLRSFNGTNYDYYSVNSSGTIVVTASGTPVNPIQYAPDGWSDKEVMWKRGFEYHGIFTTYANPLRFERDARKILRQRFYAQGTEAQLELYIEKLNESDYTYAAFYYGEFDFATFTDFENDCQCSMRDGGFMTKFQATEGNDYELPVETNDDVVWVKIDGGPPLLCSMKFTGIEQPQDDSSTPLFDQANGINMPTLLPFITEGYNRGDIFNKGNDFIGTFSQCFQQGASTFISLSMADKYYLRNTSTTGSYDIRIKGKLVIATIAGTGGSAQCKLRTLRAAFGTGTILQNHALADGITYAAGANGTETIDFDYGYALGPNECLWLTFFYTNSAKFHIYSLELEAQFQNFVPDTYVPVIPAGRVIEQLMDKMTNSGPTTADVNVLDTTYRRIHITSGDALRRLTNSQVKLSFNKAYKALNYHLDLCLKYDKTADELIIDEKETAYDNTTQIIDLGEVATLEVEPLKELNFSTLKIGSPNNVYDEINGKEEFNVTSEFSSPMQKIIATRDMVSEIRADMFGIAMTIANLTDKQQADADSDNDPFFLDVDADAVAGTFDLNGTPTNYYDLYRTPINGTAGASFFEIQNLFLDVNGTFSNEDKVFNIFFQPKRMLYRNGRFLRSILFHQGGEDLKLITTGKNTAGNVRMIVSEGATPTVYDEGVNETINDLASASTAYFAPFLFKVTAKTPANLLSIITTDPYGFVAFRWLGTSYYGFILQMSEKVAELQPGKFELIAMADTDFSNLVN